MDTAPTAREHWEARLARHKETLTMAKAARDRDLSHAYSQGVDLTWRVLGGAAGINHEAARTYARRSEQAAALPPLCPGTYLTVPISAMPEPGETSTRPCLLALALAALSFQLTGWFPPADWSADAICYDLAGILADRLPPGYYWGLAPDPNPAEMTCSYGVWPDFGL
ncbi:hypothetical protein [Streptomyces lydicus]|uniref:hypothetical protein n=1 Tax=Streptomyces lydicus TaxID=47763 RepID=UPI001010DD31|nr:hypothetical protein [Streptomyces lydicus]MCZ1012110.1 hypothetical protein [Streptomyces lydicus]